MSFNTGSRLDTRQVQDRRGRSAGARAGIGVGGVAALLLAGVFGIDPALVTNILSGTNDQPVSTGAINDECRTGQDANERTDCRVVGTVNSLNAFWSSYLPARGVDFRRPQTVLFSRATDSACGPATSDVGPFYCPGDQTMYFDTGFFQELKTGFGASGGALAEEYVVAHEFGHHVQNIIGTIGYAQRDPQGPDSGAVRVELQADCLAGLWVRHASTVADPATGVPFLAKPTSGDIASAMDAAASVGDDRIQKSATGRVNPEAWTHGSARQRQEWFARGFTSGDINQCDTFGR